MGIREDFKEVKKEVEEMKEQSDLIRILNIEDRKNRRLCWIIALLIILLVVSLGYIIYLHNDIGTEVITEETYEVDQDTENGNNGFINGDGSSINNG